MKRITTYTFYETRFCQLTEGDLILRLGFPPPSFSPYYFTPEFTPKSIIIILNMFKNYSLLEIIGDLHEVVKLEGDFFSSPSFPLTRQYPPTLIDFLSSNGISFDDVYVYIGIKRS